MPIAEWFGDYFGDAFRREFMSSSEGRRMRFSNTVTIHRSPEDVFAFLANFENVPRWNYAIAETRKTSPGPVGVGSTYRQTRTIPKRAEESFRVTEFDPPHLLAIDGDLALFSGTLTYRLEAVQEGTRLANDADLRGQGIAGLVAPLLGARLQPAVAENLRELRKLLERS